jgi:hypothetical protein
MIVEEDEVEFTNVVLSDEEIEFVEDVVKSVEEAKEKVEREMVADGKITSAEIVFKDIKVAQEVSKAMQEKYGYIDTTFLNKMIGLASQIVVVKSKHYAMLTKLHTYRAELKLVTGTRDGLASKNELFYDDYVQLKTLDGRISYLNEEIEYLSVLDPNRRDLAAKMEKDKSELEAKISSLSSEKEAVSDVSSLT